MDWLVSHGHPPASVLQYTLRQLRRVMDAISHRLDTQAQAMKNH